MIWSQEYFLQALDFAAEAHGNQKVPGSGHPYISHVVKVATEVLSALSVHPDRDVDLTVRCALLHDTLEDTKVTYASLVQHFGPAVAEGVQALTKNEDFPKEQQIKDSIDRILVLGSEIAMVKLGDRITNLAPPLKQWTTTQKERYLAESLLIRDQLGFASEYLCNRLSGHIEEYQRYIR
ncbi:MAG: HD domain-containing protein [Nanoarchaeota archaeon]|nr:HD domain-containing protein [Nanoarchaeota archaeon]